MLKVANFSMYENDICLVEAKIQRWTGQKGHDWHQGWTTGFFLLSLTKLFSAPNDVSPEPKSDCNDGRVDTDKDIDSF